jgi:hypothetical protein
MPGPSATSSTNRRVPPAMSPARSWSNKLSVLLDRLWVTAEVCEPLYNASRRGCQVA